MTQCRLRDVPVGGMARVIGIDESHRSYRSRILSMGLTRGTPIFVQRIAPFGDPIHITVRDYELSLRRDEADALVLEPIEGAPEAFGFCARCRGRGRWKDGLGNGPRGGRRHHKRDRHGRDTGASTQ
ncbi:MAG: ferrous iron transport protein A [Spirochaetaceae bacterium]|nr:MAG: ferrous iron transport protein A [Spirochaetaceae bacterium]